MRHRRRRRAAAAAAARIRRLPTSPHITPSHAECRCSACRLLCACGLPGAALVSERSYEQAVLQRVLQAKRLREIRGLTLRCPLPAARLTP